MAMLRTAVTDLLRHETLQTTDAKAREIRRMAEKIITRGKRGTLHSHPAIPAGQDGPWAVARVCENSSHRAASLG